MADTIGSRLMALRLQHRMSKLELSNILGVSDVTLFYIETDVNLPNAGTLLKYIDYFGVDGHYILTGELYGSIDNYRDRKCVSCNSIFQGGPAARFCHECRAKRDKEYHQEYSKKRYRKNNDVNL